MGSQGASVPSFLLGESITAGGNAGVSISNTNNAAGNASSAAAANNYDRARANNSDMPSSIESAIVGSTLRIEP